MLSQRIGIFAKAMDISLSEAIVYQGGLLKAELVNGAPPQNLAKAQKRADRDVKKQFHPMVSSKGGAWDLFKGRQAGRGGMRWLYAGPTYLAGVATQDFQPGLSPEAIQKLVQKTRNEPRKNAWYDQGEVAGETQSRNKKGKLIRRTTYHASRGKQHIMMLRRIVVRAGNYRQAVRAIRERFGLQKAAWAVDWDKFKIARALPGWIRKHLGRAKGITVFGLTNPERPYIQLISRATGVEHERSKANIRRALKKRYAALAIDLRLIVEGVKDKAGFLAHRGKFK